MDVEKKTNQ